MSGKRRGSQENRARLTLRKERLRNLGIADLARAHGGADPLDLVLPKIGYRQDGGCRWSEG